MPASFLLREQFTCMKRRLTIYWRYDEISDHDFVAYISDLCLCTCI